MPIGLSTSCASAAPQPAGPTGPASPEAFLDRARRAGAAGVLLDETLAPAYLMALAPRLAACRSELPVWAVANVCPTSRQASAELCALERDEAQAACEAAEQTLHLAAELGGPGSVVLLRLGEVTGVRALWPLARRAFLRAELEGGALAPRLLLERDAHAARHLDAIHRSLERLARAAEANGVLLGVRNPARPIGLPSPLELGVILERLAGAPLAPVLDLPAAHLGDAMGLRPLAETLAAWRASPLVLVADACGGVAGLVPGRGELDLPAALGSLAADARLVFAASPILDDAEVLEGLAALRALRP